MPLRDVDGQTLPPGWRDTTQTLIFADVVESVRLIAADERTNAPRVHDLLCRLESIVRQDFGGEVLERRGDGLLLSWPGAQRQAAACALAMAGAVRQAAAGAGTAERISMRFGIHCGQVFSDGQRVYGQHVNHAARVASLAKPDEVMATQALRDRLVPGVDADIEDLGECWVKHASDPIRAFRLTAPGQADVAAQAMHAPELPRPCLAVLPFRMRGAADSEEAVTVRDLIGENIVHALSRGDTLAVVSWHSSRVFDGADGAIAAPASALGAHWVVTGSCVQMAGRLVLGIELHDTRSTGVAWTCRMVTEVGELLAAEPGFAAELAQGLVLQICQGEARRLARHSLPNLTSHSILTGAIGLMHRSSRDSFLKSRDALEYLLERHPRMHAVRPWLAQWYVLRNTRGFGGDPAADAPRALEQTRRALDAEPEDARALALLGFTHFHLLHDAAAAEQFLDRSVMLNGNDPLALTFSAAIKNARAKNAESAALARGAIQVAPFDPLRDYIRGIAAGCLLSGGDHAGSIRLAEASIRENALHPYAWRVLLIASSLAGDLARARTALASLQRLGQTLTLASYRARSQLSPGDLEIAERALRNAGVPEG